MPSLTFARVHDDADLRRYHQVLEASFAADFVALPADPLADIRPGLSGFLNGEPIEFWLGLAGDDPVASLTFRYSHRDNRDLANVAVQVHPDHRSRGHGREAAEVAFARVRELGRHRILSEVPSRTRLVDPAPGQGLARAVGGRPMISETRLLLDTSELSAAMLTAVIEETASASAGYSLVIWQDDTPEELIEDMAALLALMSTDPPQGELVMEPEVWNAERYVERERGVIESGRRHLCAAARHDASGRLVGFTDLATPSGPSAVGYQWSTVVREDHRGHRLGLRMKAVNLQQLRVEIPEVRFLNTWNADVNAHMVAVNERLGFRPMEGWSEWQIDL